MDPSMAHEPRAIDDWADTGELVADLAALGYIGDDVLDLSYGYGTFWKVWQPQRLTTNDINPAKGDHSVSVYDEVPPEWRCRFRTSVWDPPFKLSGTPALGDFDERYGTDVPMTVADRLALIRIGVVRAFDCTQSGGTVLVKCQDQIVSGDLLEQTDEVKDVARAMRGKYLDRGHLRYTPRTQRSQVHLRNNFSTVMVFRKKFR